MIKGRNPGVSLKLPGGRLELFRRRLCLLRRNLGFLGHCLRLRKTRKTGKQQQRYQRPHPACVHKNIFLDFTHIATHFPCPGSKRALGTKITHFCN